MTNNNSFSNVLSEKVAIVTGASSGIGRSVAEDLVQAGLNVIATARRKDKLEELKGGRNEIVIIPGDINEPEMPEKLIAAAIHYFGRCDILIHAAGILHIGKIDEVDIEDMCEMARVNFEASVRITYSILRHFKKMGSGHLIHLSSILGTKVREGTGVYAGSKYAIEALTEALRIELAKTDIKVSAIEPGVTITELHNGMSVHPSESLEISSPLMPKDIARCVRFILEQPDYVRIPAIMILPGEQAI